jgi:hypothetical protein
MGKLQRLCEQPKTTSNNLINHLLASAADSSKAAGAGPRNLVSRLRMRKTGYKHLDSQMAQKVSLRFVRDDAVLPDSATKIEAFFHVAAFSMPAAYRRVGGRQA